MEDKTRNHQTELEGTNLYPIYPDLDAETIPAGTNEDPITDEQLTQEVDTVNPDPGSLDRG